MRPEPAWCYRLRTSVGLQTILLFVAVPIVTWAAVLVLDAAAGVDKYGAPLACTRAEASR